jgi:hypothetical protein
VGEAVASGVLGNAPERVGGVTGRGFVPGRSGNPGGQPKGMAEVRAAARSHTALAMATLARCCTAPDAAWAAKVAAATALLDRGWGRPAQPVDLNNQRPLAALPVERLLAALDSLAAAGGGGVAVAAMVAVDAGEAGEGAGDAGG